MVLPAACINTDTDDALGRLVSKTSDSDNDDRDYTDAFTYDLASNRLTQERTSTTSGANDFETTYTYDANDRLITEYKYVDGSTGDRFTEYDYNNTQQTDKIVYEGDDDQGTVLETHTYSYDATGRMTSVTVDKTGSGGGTTTQTYTYDARGLRVSQTDSATGETTTYLFDPSGGHTGYAQVLEEYVDSGSGATLEKTYTLGHDVIAQASAAASQILTLLHDGHGSTRALVNAIAEIVQRFAYDAYGVQLTGTGLTDAANALTTLLYSGEAFNAATGLQYLRARPGYDPTIGRFTTIDPWSGNINDPISLHKYLYVHANPIMGVDPSGREFTLTGRLAVATITVLLVGIAAVGIHTALNVSAGYYLDGYDLVDPKQRYMAIIEREAKKQNLHPAFLTAILDAELSDIDAYDRYGDFIGAFIGLDTSIGVGQLNVSTVRQLRPGSGRLKAILLARNPETNIELTAEYLRLIADNAKALAVANSSGLNQSNINQVVLRAGLVGLDLDDFKKPGSQWTSEMIEVMGYNYTQPPWQLVHIGTDPNWYRLAQYASQTGSYGEYVRERYDLFKPLFP